MASDNLVNAIAMIPAKGSSDRVPGKNLRKLGGGPLIQWTIDGAFRVQRISDVYVLTDCDEIHEAADEVGAGVIMRPQQLSERDVSATDVTVWATKMLGLDGDETAIVQLLPTSPFRTAAHINEALDLWEKDPRASVVSVRMVDKQALRYETGQGWLAELKAPGWSGRPFSECPDTFISTGGIQIASATTLRTFGQFHIPKTRAIVLDSIAGLDIDTEADWKMAEGIAQMTEVDAVG